MGKHKLINSTTKWLSEDLSYWDNQGYTLLNVEGRGEEVLSTGLVQKLLLTFREND